MINPDPKMIAQLNLLSDLIGSNSAGDSSRSGVLKLSLFDDDDEEEDNGPPYVLLIDWNIYFDDRFHCLRISKRPPPSSSTTRQQPKNEDVTIDVSKVFLGIEIDTTIVRWIDF